MSECGTFHGALRFPMSENASPRPLQVFAALAQSVLEDFSCPTLETVLEADNRMWISAVDYDVTLSLDAHRVSVDLSPTGTACGDDATGQTLLSVLLYRLASETDAEKVEWLSSKTVISADLFLRTFDPVAREEAVQSAHPIYTPVDDTASELDQVCDRLTARQIEAAPVASHATPEDQKDLSERILCWGMTLFAGLIFAPVAIAMAFVNVIRGEDFRRNAHALTLTFALIALTSGGALAGAFQFLSP